MSAQLVNINDEDLENFYKLLDDFPSFAIEFLRIKDEAGNIIPFVLNELQMHVCSIVLPKILGNEKVWVNILKCRQTGISTLFEAIFFWLSLREQNQKFLIMAHEQAASENIYAMFYRYYENMPEAMQPRLDQSQRGKKLKYAKLGNEVEVKTAGAGVDSNKAGTGRSSTYQYIHATECAFYPDYKTSFVGLLQASKNAKLIVLETTANGFNDYRNAWVDSLTDKKDFIPIFLSWTDFKTYSKPFANEYEKERLQADLGANMRYNAYKSEEDKLVSKHNCNLEQLNWRRWAIDNICESDVDMFHQEYPAAWEEAFLASGRPVFDVNVCSENLNNAKEPILIGDLTNDGNGEIEFVENPKGYIKIHKKIKIGDDEHYILAAGCDVAEGLEQGDRSIIKVYDRRTSEVVMTWSGHIDPDLLAEEQYKIQKYYKNQVHFCTEANNHGLSTIISAFKRGVNQYYRQDFEKGYEAQKMNIGWKTSERTKKIMIDLLKKYIREDELSDYEEDFWSECITFVKNERGQMQAQNKDKDPSTKCYDDRVMAAALMLQCHFWLPSYYKDIKHEADRRYGFVEFNEHNEASY